MLPVEQPRGPHVRPGQPAIGPPPPGGTNGGNGGGGCPRSLGASGPGGGDGGMPQRRSMKPNMSKEFASPKVGKCRASFFFLFKSSSSSFFFFFFLYILFKGHTTG